MFVTPLKVNLARYNITQGYCLDHQQRDRDHALDNMPISFVKYGGGGYGGRRFIGNI
jgi:hypothetical protein